MLVASLAHLLISKIWNSLPPALGCFNCLNTSKLTTSNESFHLHRRSHTYVRLIFDILLTLHASINFQLLTYLLTYYLSIIVVYSCCAIALLLLLLIITPVLPVASCCAVMTLSFRFTCVFPRAVFHAHPRSRTLLPCRARSSCNVANNNDYLATILITHQ